MRGFRLHRLLAGPAEFVARGSVGARIIDLGSYPGAVPDTAATVTARSTGSRIRRCGRCWTRRKDPSIIARVVTVRSEDGRELAASIYWYIGPLDRGVPIPGGDYRAHAPATSIYHQSP